MPQSQSQGPYTNSSLSRILQRTGSSLSLQLNLAARRSSRSLFQTLTHQENNSTLSVGTTCTALPLYSRSETVPAPPYAYAYCEGAQAHRRSSIVPPYPNSHQVDTYSFPVRTSSSTSAKPWVTMHLYSPRAKAIASGGRPAQPRVYGGQLMQGLVEFNIEKPMTVHEVKVQVKGRIIMGANANSHHTFLSHTFSVWNRGLGDPRKAKTSLGNYEFPVSVPFPTDINRRSDHLNPAADSAGGAGGGVGLDPVAGDGHIGLHSPTSSSSSSRLSSSSSSSTLQNGAQAQASTSASTTSSTSASASVSESQVNTPGLRLGCGTSLPPSFLENEMTVTVQYEVNLLVTHGMFRSETKITAPVTFIPTITPPPVPLERRLVYEAAHASARGSDSANHLRHGVMTPGPSVDPTGWFALPSKTLSGYHIVGGTKKDVKVKCELFIAQPLSYTNTSFIPCFLSLSSDSTHALDVLCTPSPSSAPTSSSSFSFSSPPPSSSSSITPHPQLKVHLLRKLTHPTHDMTQNAHNTAYMVTLDMYNCASVAVVKDVQHVTVGTRVAEAVWKWCDPTTVTKSVEESAMRRWMVGEIHFPRGAGGGGGLVTSSTCSFFSVEYFVQMTAVNVNDSSFVFEDTNEDDGVIVSQLVEIASTYASEGPVPVPFMRPNRTSYSTSTTTAAASGSAQV
ncbi:hypothetical protein CVT24_004538 [Panaeolus cyanescens]|uniref:Arrestin-like N-terminal domain-containing protein n=1 Tax=Panaeolus cyanescens TaxID=181874 RepID=A0A409YBX2_9AGAR|nr:hypothetical protein CVT24_004538 [Panaeolus cyanescens]